MPAQNPSGKFDLSGGVQTSTSRLLAKANEVLSAKNAAFNVKIGSATRRAGYEQVGPTIQNTYDSLGAGVYKYYGNNKVLVAINNQANTNATVKYLNSDSYWNDIITDAAPNTRFNFLNHLDELYVAGVSDNGTYLTLQNVDSTLTPSTTRNVLNAPKCKFIGEFQGRLYAMNVQIGNAKYTDRIYLSSAPTGAVTFVQNDQKGLLKQLKVDTVKYLKPNMVVDIYGAGSSSLQVSGLTIISVDKNTNTISFADTTLNLHDNDEIWITGRKNLTTQLWNTDYPTEQASDFIRIPPGVEQNPEITGYGKSNNRMFFFTENSAWKWDGQNLINVSEYVGCASHETIKQLGSWLVWLHKTGVWGWNDSTGQLKLLSRTIQNYTNAITQANLKKASAVVNGRVYKLAVGELQELEGITTSTSTSSTSTSSTSSSTSSTSTSSTSTSSTSSSTSLSTTSTSTSSTSTSSTSTSISSTTTTSTSSTSTSSTSSSTSSTSISTSSTSTSTTTVAGGRQIVRLIYDFDMNAWWPEYHRREIRFQFMHTMHGYTKPYFTDDTGRLFRDETGFVDHNDTIPFEVTTYREHLGTRYNKKFDGCVVESEHANSTQVFRSIDNEQFINVGEIDKDVQFIRFDGDTPQGRDIAYKFTHNDAGSPPSIDGIETYFSNQEIRMT